MSMPWVGEPFDVKKQVMLASASLSCAHNEQLYSFSLLTNQRHLPLSVCFAAFKPKLDPTLLKVHISQSDVDHGFVE
ncbi:hypothetical protein [Serratia proteamaculans]|uniref:hypothetical protein n=1 Tax=Serratia proteamaculans TaxID=28151 RepID=UPI0021BAC8C0|nr:hypothetical protein [Serratia proteamaculans]